ncbi:MAG: hypothetical protein ACRDBY_14110 [Cetobacterium sp.]
MANLKDLIKKYEESNNGGDFPKWLSSLKNDGDNVMVRFLHSNEDDLDVVEVHKVEVDGYEQKIECNGDNCLFCKRGLKKQLRMFVQMLDLSDNTVKIWERGITDIKTLLEEIDENGDLDRRDYKIKRSGAKGSKKTLYMYYAKAESIRELPARTPIHPWYVKQCTNTDMQLILDGNFTFKKDTLDTSNNNDNAMDETVDDGDLPF